MAKARFAAMNGSEVPQSRRNGIPANALARAKTSWATKSARSSKAPRRARSGGGPQRRAHAARSADHVTSIARGEPEGAVAAHRLAQQAQWVEVRAPSEPSVPGEGLGAAVHPARTIAPTALTPQRSAPLRVISMLRGYAAPWPRGSYRLPRPALCPSVLSTPRKIVEVRGARRSLLDLTKDRRPFRAPRAAREAVAPTARTPTRSAPCASPPCPGGYAAPSGAGGSHRW